MSLPILGARVVLGITGIVLTVRLMGWSGDAAVGGAAGALEALSGDFPDARFQDPILSDDDRAAVVPSDRGPALVAAMGVGCLTRIFAPGEIAAIEDGATGLTLRLRDWTAPKLAIACEDGARRDAMKAILKGERA